MGWGGGGGGACVCEKLHCVFVPHLETNLVYFRTLRSV